jgi:NAD-dependent dihydropyrimidine dehydrogenase PreA subunit
VVDPNACVGCGMCVQVCPAQPEAIRVQKET